MVTNPINLEFYEKAHTLFTIGNYNNNHKVLEKLHNKCTAIFNAILDNPNKANSFSDLVLLFVDQAKGLAPITCDKGEMVAKPNDEELLLPCFERVLVTARAKKASPKNVESTSVGKGGYISNN